VIKEAFAARLLEDAQVWIDMMLHRNLLSHTYELKVFEAVLQASDIDLALVGIEDGMQAAAIAEELEELPLPYRFDVKLRSAITHPPLEEHIWRVGITLYQRDPPDQEEGRH